MLTFADRCRGALLGLAVGDALGAAVEFRAPGTFVPVTGMRGGGPFGLDAGYWTDDTSMALCLAESLLECSGFDARDQMQRYVRWYREGYLSSIGRCFDIGNATRAALARFERTGDPCAGSADPQAAGNGSLMRLAPVPLFFFPDEGAAVEQSAASSRTTHGARTCVDACRYTAQLICRMCAGARKDEALFATDLDLCPEIREIADGSFRRLEPPAIKGSGYVVKSLEAALWAFWKHDTFADAVLAAVNLGDDADTTGAIAGQIAGAFYGAAGIPPEWLRQLPQREMMEGFADRLSQPTSARG